MKRQKLFGTFKFGKERNKRVNMLGRLMKVIYKINRNGYSVFPIL